MGLTGLATYGTDIGSVLRDWESLGIFSYVLPFLLIFAVVFAVLDRIKVFEGKKGINMVIALAVGLLSLQFEFVPIFFAEIFPRMGIGLSVVLVGLILAGAFFDWSEKKGPAVWIFFGLGALVFLVVIADAFASFSLFGGGWWQQYGSAIIILLVIIGLIVGVMTGSKGGSSSGSANKGSGGG